MALFGPAFAPGARLQALTLAADERLVGSLCKRHAVTTYVAPTACGRTVSGTVSLPCSRCFSPFPHGTCALSVSRECLALADGAAGFGQGSSDPALLRVPARLATVSRTGLSPATARLSRRLPLPSLRPRCRPYYPARASTPAVWACPLSLAATRGVTVVFLSSDYWDVSVRRVRLPTRGMPRLRAAGCPIRTPADQRPFAPPRGLSRPAASFLASGSQGILRTPCLASRSRLSLGVSLHLARSCVSLSLCLLSLSHPVKEPRRTCPA